jgi:hypothetical protein
MVKFRVPAALPPYFIKVTMWFKKKHLFVSYFGYKDHANGREWVFGNCFDFQFEISKITPRTLSLAETDIKQKCELDNVVIINFKLY